MDLDRSLGGRLLRNGAARWLLGILFGNLPRQTDQLSWRARV